MASVVAMKVFGTVITKSPDIENRWQFTDTTARLIAAENNGIFFPDHLEKNKQFELKDYIEALRRCVPNMIRFEEDKQHMWNLFATCSRKNAFADLKRELKYLDTVRIPRIKSGLDKGKLVRGLEGTIHAKDGESAVQMLEDHPETDLILMDILLPVMDGLQATRLIRQKNRDIPIIAQTALAMEGDEQKSIDAGCNDYISKPIMKKELLGKISLYLKK